MTLDQKRARAFGVLFLITFATSIPAALRYGPWSTTAVVIVPIMRRFDEELAIGSRDRVGDGDHVRRQRSEPHAARPARRPQPACGSPALIAHWAAKARW
jgi:hypothetical protein